MLITASLENKLGSKFTLFQNVVKLDKEYHEFLNSYWNYYETYLFKEKKIVI